MELNALQTQTLSLDMSSNRNGGVPEEILPVLQQVAHVSAIVWPTTNLKEGAYGWLTPSNVIPY